MLLYRRLTERTRAFHCRNCTANLRTNIVDFRGFDSSIILILRLGIFVPIGDFPEDLSQAILAGIMLVGKLGVLLEISNSMNPFPSVVHTDTNKLKPIIGFVEPTNLDEDSNRVPPTSHHREHACHRKPAANGACGTSTLDIT